MNGDTGPGPRSPAQVEPTNATPVDPGGGSVSWGPGADAGANATANATAAGASGGGGGGGGLFSVDPFGWFVAILEGVALAIYNGVAAFVEGINTVFFGIDAPGTLTDFATWTGDLAAPWGAAWLTYWLSAGIGLTILTAGTMYAHAEYDVPELRAFYRDLIPAFVMVLFGWWVAVFGLHLGNAGAMWLAPSGAEFMATPGNTAKLGLGVVVGPLALIANTGTTAIAGGAVLVLRYIAVLAVIAWPITWAFYPFRGGIPTTVYGLGVTTYLGVIGVRLFQALFARFIFNIQWSPADPGEMILAFAGTIIGILIVFIGLPIVAGRNFLPEMMTTLGQSRRGRSGFSVDEARDNIRVAAEFAQSARGRIGNARDRFPTPTASSSSGGGGSSSGSSRSHRGRSWGGSRDTRASPGGSNASGSTTGSRRKLKRNLRNRDP